MTQPDHAPSTTGEVKPFANPREMYMTWANERGPWPALYGLLDAYARLTAQLKIVEGSEALALQDRDATLERVDRLTAQLAEAQDKVRAYNELEDVFESAVEERDQLKAQLTERDREIERLRAALQRIVNSEGNMAHIQPSWYVQIASDALGAFD